MIERKSVLISGRSGPDLARQTASSTGSTVPGRHLGRVLREFRTGAGLSVEEVAAELKCRPQKVGRIESGQGAVRGREVRAMCELYGVPPKTTVGLVRLAAEVGAKGWWCPYGGTVPDGFELYAGLEVEASRLREYHGALVPALLQTRGYASALLSGQPNTSERERERLVEGRLRRQALLTRSLPTPPRFEAMLSEAVLLAKGVGPAVLDEQLRHLLEVSRLPHVSLRVVPFSAGPHFGAVAGPFVLLDFPAPVWGVAEPPVVYRESLTGALYLDRAEEIATYEKVWASLDAFALDEERSRDIISKAAHGVRRPA